HHDHHGHHHHHGHPGQNGPGHHAAGHHHYHYPALVRRLEESELGETARSFALEVFRLLGEAEAHAHGVPLERVTFHEVGAMDSVVDVAMAGVCVEKAGADRILASPVKLGRGSIRIAHGTYPVPPPASARLALGMPVEGVPKAIARESVELSTPTGLAILRALKPEFVTGWPGGTLLAQGMGSGAMEFREYPNVFRVVLLEGHPATTSLPFLQDRVAEIRCNVDDQTGERTAWLMERALELGALDAWVTALLGKKGRPAHEMALLVRPEDRDRFAEFLLRHSTTLGVRFSTWDRMKLVREEEVRATPLGPVSYKVGKTTDGTVLKEKPEYEDLKKLWEEDPGFS
ncbi:MAG: LarC family nickel insertion protein, partial [Longimicrobiales bacterium]